MAYYSDRDYETLEYHAVDPDAAHNDGIDLMSFMSVIARSEDTNTEKWTSLVLLSIHLGPWNLFLPFTPYRGAFFSVTVVPRRYILRQTDVSLDSGHSIPNLVALKTPRLGQDDKRNSRLFRSIAKEYQILQSESLKHHENIVSVCGCCWQSLDTYAGPPIPCLILEGTELGDLVNFSQTRELTLRERLRICIHVTSGLKAIHSIGIVHGDLKPENILVFHSKQRGYTAKIADFGAAILLGETTLPCRKPIGTILYSAPECYDHGVAFGREELFKTDIFSLGIVLSALIQGMYVLEELKKLQDSRLESLKREGQLDNWMIALSYQDSKDMATQHIIGSADHDTAWETDPALARILFWQMNKFGRRLSLCCRERLPPLPLNNLRAKKASCQFSETYCART
jgi:serine/threonine protein kinase